MAKRPLISAMFQGPGPAAYILPPCLGSEDHDKTRCQAPSYTMGKRLALKDGQKFDQHMHFPNPKLTRFGISNIPGCIGVRLSTEKKAITPGPADYSPDHRTILKSEPNYSMSRRLEMGRKFVTPAPNEYNLPRMLGPALSTARSSPNYTMRPRTQNDDFSTVSPGPATYTPETNATTTRTPQWIFGSKVGHNEQKLGPGPSKYLPSLYVRTSPAAYTMGIRHSVYKYDAPDAKTGGSCCASTKYDPC